MYSYIVSFVGAETHSLIFQYGEYGLVEQNRVLIGTFNLEIVFFRRMCKLRVSDRIYGSCLT